MARILAVLSLLLAAGCHDGPGRYSGYVEGEYVRVAAPVAGQLLGLHVARGAQVAFGAPLFELEQAREHQAVDAASERIHQQEAQLKFADGELQRQQKLRSQGVTSAQDLDNARTQAVIARQRLDELEAQLDQEKWQLEQRTVVAPVAGLVEDTYYRTGEWVPAGAPVVSVLPPQNRFVRFFVPEGVAGGVQPGRAVRISCDGCAKPVDATVSFVAPQAEYTPPVIYSRETRDKLVFMIEARPAAGDALLLHPGQPVEVELM